MTIAEAIAKYEKSAVEKEMLATFYTIQADSKADIVQKFANEKRQLAEWLKDYKKLLGAIEDIKVEIEQLHDLYKVNYQGHSMSVAQQCLDIIDKHTSGKEN